MGKTQHCLSLHINTHGEKTASGILNRHQRNVCTQQYLSACVNVLFRGNDRKKEREREVAAPANEVFSSQTPCRAGERGSERGRERLQQLQTSQRWRKNAMENQSAMSFSPKGLPPPIRLPLNRIKKQKAAEEEIPLITLERHDEVQEANVLDTLFLLKERGKDLMARRRVLFQLNGGLSFRL